MNQKGLLSHSQNGKDSLREESKDNENLRWVNNFMNLPSRQNFDCKIEQLNGSCIELAHNQNAININGNTMNELERDTQIINSNVKSDTAVDNRKLRAPVSDHNQKTAKSNDLRY